MLGYKISVYFHETQVAGEKSLLRGNFEYR